MAKIFFTDTGAGIAKKFVERTTLAKAQDFCGRPGNCFNYVSKIGYRLERETVADSLEYLRGELRAECISLDELHELQSLADHIPADDTELREAAGIPEN